MLKITKEKLYQWDVDVKVYVPLNVDAQEVHFAHKNDEKALVVDVKTENDRQLADIPNILLQSNEHIKVWLVKDGQTLCGNVLQPTPRAKPDDYVYTETEIKKYETLEKRIAALEEGGTSSGIAEESDPTVPQWAKQPQKPTYTADEVGAASKEDIRQLSKDIDDLKQNGAGGGVTTEQANSLWAIMQKTAFSEQLTDEELNAFKTAWGIGGEEEPDEPNEPDNPEVTLTSISATYTGGEVAVGTSVNSLTGITVTATYSDGSTKTVTGYTLSGTIAEGSNTIKVSYGGKTAAFTVTGVAESGGEETGVSNEITWTDGVPYTYTSISGYVEKTDGSFTDHSTWHRTPYLYCENASKLRVSVRTANTQMGSTAVCDFNAFYDKDKNFIESFSFLGIDQATVGSYVDIEIPYEAVYFVASGKAAFVTTTTDSKKPYAEITPIE